MLLRLTDWKLFRLDLLDLLQNPCHVGAEDVMLMFSTTHQGHEANGKVRAPCHKIPSAPSHTVGSGHGIKNQALSDKADHVKQSGLVSAPTESSADRPSSESHVVQCPRDAVRRSG